MEMTWMPLERQLPVKSRQDGENSPHMMAGWYIHFLVILQFWMMCFSGYFNENASPMGRWCVSHFHDSSMLNLTDWCVSLSRDISMLNLTDWCVSLSRDTSMLNFKDQRWFLATVWASVLRLWRELEKAILTNHTLPWEAEATSIIQLNHSEHNLQAWRTLNEKSHSSSSCQLDGCLSGWHR